VFSIDDYWKILEYLKSGTEDPDLSELTRNLATSEKEKTNQYFENIVDQTSFAAEDYRRLRSYLIDWYAAFRTITTTQKDANDVHSLPDEHLSELFRSFGYPVGLKLVPLSAKANLFLDLVNFYKKKGTPETMADVLDYYGFTDADLIEYWLRKDEFGNIVFRGVPVRLAATGSTALIDTDISFDRMTENDPHWLLEEAKILQLFDENKINLPSKTPYFSLSSTFYLHKLTGNLAIMNRIIQDQYARYLSSLPLPQDVQIRNIGEVTSLLEAYLATIYAFEVIYGVVPSSLYNLHACYDGTINYTATNPPIPQNLPDLSEEYENLVSQVPTDRDDVKTKLETLWDDWSRDVSTNFLGAASGTAGPLLQTMNPVLKDVCDDWIVSGEEVTLMTNLLGTLDNWIKLNVDTRNPSMIMTTLGLNFRDDLEQIINFFKPYRARLAFVDTAFSMQNRLTESILLDDALIDEIQQSHSDDVDVTDDLEQDIEHTIEDQVLVSGDGCPNPGFYYYDSGGYYDETVALCEYFEVLVTPVLRDDIFIDSSADMMIMFDSDPEYPRGTQGPMMYDIGNEYDVEVQAPIVDDHVEIVTIP